MAREERKLRAIDRVKGGAGKGLVLGVIVVLGLGGFSPDDIAASFFHNLGINHEKEYKTASGRPIMIARYGNVIEELFA